MTNGPIIRGWCPGALRPMMSGDGLVVRIRVRNGYLRQEQANALADLSRRFGNGVIEVTTRANLQLRGVTTDNHPALVDALQRLNLLDRDPQTEARRNIILSPFAPKNGAAWKIATHLADLITAPDAPNLPAKFGFAVDDGNCLSETPCDIRIIRAHPRPRTTPACTGPAQWHIAPDGTCDTFPAGAAPAQAAIDLARWFLNSGGAPQGRGRMRAHLARGAIPPMPTRTSPRPPAWHPSPGPVANGWLTGLPFGILSSDQLAALSATGPIRLTPWHMLLSEGLTRAPGIAGLIDDPANPLLQTHACTGAPDCPQALAETRNLAKSLAPRLRPGQTLHISGCAKGCAYRGRADITLVAQDQNHFALIENGTSADKPKHARLRPADITL